MSKAIEVRSRQFAKTFKSEVPWAAISVSTKSDDFAVLPTENRVGLLQLCFWDIANPKFEDIEGFDDKLFSKEQAKQVLEFVAQYWESVECFLVHCEAGISRSPAIAAAIEYIYHGKAASLPYFNRFTPNGFVYKTLLEQFYGQHSVAADDAKRIISDAAYQPQIYDEPWDCKEP